MTKKERGLRSLNPKASRRDWPDGFTGGILFGFLRKVAECVREGLVRNLHQALLSVRAERSLLYGCMAWASVDRNQGYQKA